ncbi:hypothetical protein [Deinococcus soli (ex Cha et al. 2016)]|uniref:Uncharacterized protein n=2 Tax=Deinococcus soli (ex Cha et al. 2016) TaxID=1309411 RepID=A0ACC6KHG1_9DEIO|nr:hypothetical protein [Deinococcus soli (ex Cha et al. 2016)]MDR6218766.1 hypothetical protein [Deinococcus soli (ex Cha et al. 2016)]MDR6328563.1 hypothetical protein [Deinococcus soli (ex Cha et al. 2016)]MDR6751950.1 hypothetical protein [Deinococcus soli (ex Cha et al. 2016)]
MTPVRTPTQHAQITAARAAFSTPRIWQRALRGAAQHVGLLSDENGAVYLTRVDGDLHSIEGTDWGLLFSTSAQRDTPGHLLDHVDPTRPDAAQAPQAIRELHLTTEALTTPQFQQALAGAHTGVSVLIRSDRGLPLVTVEHLSGDLYRLRGGSWNVPFSLSAQPGTLRRLLTWEVTRAQRRAHPDTTTLFP